MLLFVIPLPPSNLSPYLSNLDTVRQTEKERGGQRINAKQEQRGGKNGKEIEREKEVLVTDKKKKQE